MMRCLTLTAVLLCGAMLPAAEPDVKIGTMVGDLRFKDLRYLARSLRDFGDRRAYVLVFVDNGCPLVAKYLPVLQELERKYRVQDVQFVAVNSGPNDLIAEMAGLAVEHGVEFPFVKDLDCRVADAVGVTRTPEVVVLDGQRTLRYRGRIDDRYRPGGTRNEPTRHDLAEAIEAVLAGREVEVATTPIDGCLIHRPANQLERAPTYAEHVAPILARSCQGCHQPESAAPFALLTYEQTKARGRTIAEVVSEGRMPPWFAPRREGDLIQHQSLTAEERETIRQWVLGGMLRGESSPTPARVEGTAPAKWKIGEPDLVLTGTPFEAPSTGDIPYKYLVFPHVFVEDTWVSGVQILPDPPRSVHHANLAYFKLGESFRESNFITGVVPGGSPMMLDGGVAFLIPKGMMLGLQVHYVTTGKPETVRISVGLKYASGRIDQRLHHMLFVDKRYTIPAGAPAHSVKVTRTLEHDALGIGLFAHMHLRGKAMSFVAHLPSGETERLLTIANYNFEWQIPYRWEPGKKVLPKGTRLECIALYDNSSFNPYNPDPNSPVKDGPQTYHEMLNGFMFYVDANEKLGLDIDPKTGRAK